MKNPDKMSERELRAEVKGLRAENIVLREGVEDFISQIDDCKSAHTVCGQFTSLAKAIQENLAATEKGQ